MDSLEYAQRVGVKIEGWLREGCTLTWTEMVQAAGDEVMAEEAEEA